MNTEALTESQLEHYKTHGFVGGIDVLNPDQTAIAFRKLIALEADELTHRHGQWMDTSYQPWTERRNPWWHWFKPMCTHPTIIASVKSVLGPNLFIRNADIFIKPVDPRLHSTVDKQVPSGPMPEGLDYEIRWHVDTVAPPTPAGKMVTAWLGLTDSSLDNGCMEWLPGSHLMALPPECKDKHSLTFKGKNLRMANGSVRVANEMQAGQLSIHHFRTVHRSGINVTPAARVGLVIRFMAADTDPEVAESGRGFLVAGKPIDDRFSLMPTFPVTWKRSDRSFIAP